ncbi:hypothetical protein SAMN05421640_2244 [Ekhidna lutea]|uniref:Uncharacterized protein n=1 Tax=Ekhidna lutea TaxID=447679 RepID=A0A239JPV1_EKHLU|nr:DUF6588 family protein [Ekhidna lutea]SNT06814.1 hypothetical protein SAMN05421640_2244 [Ekhidna lutea]
MKKILIILSIIASPFIGKSQVDFGNFLEASAQDANTLLENYLEPAFLGFGYGINSGWYNTAKPHKLFGFDITPTFTLAMVPSSGEFFRLNDSDYTSLRVDPNGPTDSQGNLIRDTPTLFGPNLNADFLPMLEYTDPEGNSYSISTPTGLGLEESIPFNAVPSGMIQVGIGLMKNTDLKIRIVPAIESENEYSFEMFGIGVMHDLKQWVPGFKQLPLDVSGFVGWNRMTTQLFLDADAPDQIAQFQTNGFTLQGLVSKQLSILTVFGGVGIANTKTTFNMLGTYDTEAGTVTDPIDFSFLSTGPRINLGFRLKLLILTLHADYAIQKYNTLTIGAGFSIR